MKESDVQKAIYREYGQRKGITAVVPNIYFFDRFLECDVLAFTDNGMVIEFEVKASKWDYLEDFKKKDKHDRMEAANDKTIIPNQFYFVCPEGLISPAEIPNGYAGLIYVCKSKTKALSMPYLKTIVKAPIIHNIPLDSSKWEELAVKLAKRLW